MSGAHHDEPAELPQSWSIAEVTAALHLPPRQVTQLITQGQVGYYRAGRSKRMLARHVEQVITALEIQPRQPLELPEGPLGPTDPEYYRRFGVTERSAVMRSRKAMREQFGHSRSTRKKQ